MKGIFFMINGFYLAAFLTVALVSGIFIAALYVINKKSKNLKVLQENYSKLNDEKILTEKNLAELTQLNNEIKQKLQESKNNFSQEKSKLENQINTLISENNSFETKNTELTQKLKISNESLNILQDEIVELKNKIEKSNLIVNSVLQNTKIFNGHHYKVFNAKLNWDDAKKICESMGGHLATIISNEEQEFIVKTFVSRNPSQFYWLGGFGDEKNWQWITDEKWTAGDYLGTKWKSWGLVAQMNSAMTDGKLAISGKTTVTGTIYFNDKYNYICEWDF